jgi:hypothetical protein
MDERVLARSTRASNEKARELGPGRYRKRKGGSVYDPYAGNPACLCGPGFGADRLDSQEPAVSDPRWDRRSLVGPTTSIITGFFAGTPACNNWQADRPAEFVGCRDHPRRSAGPRQAPHRLAHFTNVLRDVSAAKHLSFKRESPGISPGLRCDPTLVNPACLCGPDLGADRSDS